VPTYVERELSGYLEWRIPAHGLATAVNSLQRLDSALNEHWHYHRCVSDGVFPAANG